MKNKIIISNLMKILIIIIGLWGIYESITKFPNSTVKLYFYTTLTNIACIIFSIFYLYKNINKKTYNVNKERIINIIYYIITVSIFIVSLTYNLIIFPNYHTNLINYGMENFIFHLIVPILFVCDWLIFAKKDSLNIKSIYYCLIPFIAYLIGIYFRAFFIGTKIFSGPNSGNSLYPYFFLDIDKLGLSNVIIYIFIILILILILEYILEKFGKKIKLN
ncbi:Pr6Pr family membrane protein [Methanobrevibacter acididurans]|uniref:Pr6Pr family membrane protein n=1 Tax=Methanobrevibacter acididurans TaxID=120963 RepID=UPI0038FD0ED9